MKSFYILLAICLSFYTCGLFAQDQLNDPQVDYPGSPEMPLTSNLITELYSLNSAGQIFAAWKLLAEQKDGYAVSAAKIFGDEVTVGKCVVESNWKVVVGEEVRARLYDSYAKSYQYSYIEFLDVRHRYPNSLEIEKLYQQADDAMELPQYISVDLLLNVIPLEWKKRLFFDRFSSLIGVGRMVNEKHWFDYTDLSRTRVVSESILAKNISIEDAEAIYSKDASLIAKCMLRKLRPPTPNPSKN